MKITFDIEPVSQLRPRFSIKPFPHEYDPPKVKKYKQDVGYLAKFKMHALGQKPLDGPLQVKIAFYRPVQKSISKKERLRRLNSVTLPAVKADIDNYVKAFLDALNGVVWVDDALITDLHAIKRYSDKPRIDLEVNKLG